MKGSYANFLSNVKRQYALFIFLSEPIRPRLSIERIIIHTMLLSILIKATAPDKARQADHEWPDRS